MQAAAPGPDKLESVKAEFLKMEEMGIVWRYKSPLGFPLHVVEKMDGSLRPCGDYRLLNQHMHKDRYALPLLRDFASNLAGSTCFSVLDLTKAYYQVPLAKDAILKTAIITPFL